jgi:F-box protein 42
LEVEFFFCFLKQLSVFNLSSIEGCNGSLNNKTNNIYCLCLKTLEWFKKEINGIKPESRYGHSQVTVNDEHILIVGGCGGPNHLYDDVWCLTLPKYTNNGFWQKILIRQSFNAPIQLHCVSLVRCEDKLITFGRPKALLNEINPKRVCSCLTNNSSSSSSNVTLNVIKQPPVTDEHKKIPLVNTNNKILNKSDRNTVKRNEMLQNMANKYIYARLANHLNGGNSSNNNGVETNMFSFSRPKLNQCIIHSKLMQVFVLDIKTLISNLSNINNNNNSQLLEVAWMEPIFNFKNAPTNTILYSLTKGINEILLFGGMEIDSTYSNNIQNNNNNNHEIDNEIVRHKICNDLYIMKANNLF